MDALHAWLLEEQIGVYGSPLFCRDIFARAVYQFRSDAKKNQPSEKEAAKAEFEEFSAKLREVMDGPGGVAKFHDEATIEGLYAWVRTVANLLDRFKDTDSVPEIVVGSKAVFQYFRLHDISEGEESLELGIVSYKSYLDDLRSCLTELSGGTKG